MSSNPDPSGFTPPRFPDDHDADDRQSAGETISRPPSGDELLPPIEPPSGTFILQLFVYPAVIVLAVVGIWLLVTSLATRSQNNPEQIVGALRSSAQTRWQKANELADMLRLEGRYPELKHNAEFAAQLATLLDEEITEGADDDNSIQLRYFLCRVLGEFYVDEGLPVLLRAAREDEERDVRREAINATAVLAESLQRQDPSQSLVHPDLDQTFIELANDRDELIRSQAAFALGVITLDEAADPILTTELEKLADDLFVDARYNAALGLARRGSPIAIPVLMEMVDLESLAISLKGEEDEAAQSYKRNMVLHNALNAIETVRDENADRNLSELRDAVAHYVEQSTTWEAQGGIPKPLVDRGKEVLAGFE